MLLRQYNNMKLTFTLSITCVLSDLETAQRIYYEKDGTKKVVEVSFPKHCKALKANVSNDIMKN